MRAARPPTSRRQPSYRAACKRSPGSRVRRRSRRCRKPEAATTPAKINSRGSRPRGGSAPAAGSCHQATPATRRAGRFPAGTRLEYAMRVAASSTMIGPSWAMHSANMIAVSTAANGTPAIASPMPPSADCTSAVTTTRAPRRGSPGRPARPCARPARLRVAARSAAPRPPTTPARVEDRGEDHDQHELHQQEREAARLLRKPRCGRTRVRLGLRQQVRHALAGQSSPCGPDSLTRQRHLAEPLWRGG